MLAIRNFDEVNNYVKNKRSVDFQEIFWRYGSAGER